MNKNFFNECVTNRLVKILNNVSANYLFNDSECLLKRIFFKLKRY